jgi:GTP pyrophosphokinase
MSPKGKVVELPIGSCPIDFAYRIHSNVGHSCTGALVNGLMVPLNTELHTGDIVEIKTSKIHTEPSEGWMQFVRTSAAKNAIRKYLQKKQKENNKDIMIASGKSQLDEQIREQQLNDKTLDETLNDITFLQQFGVTKLDELYFAISNRTVNVNNICDKIKSRKFKELKPTFEFKKKTVKKSSNCGVIVNGIDNIKVELSMCCHPIPGDEIVGYITRGRGVKVHCKNCPTLATLDNRLIDVEWDMEVNDNIMHQVNLIVRAGDRTNLLLEIMNVLSTLKITVLELNAISHKESLNASVQLSIMVKDSAHLNSIINSLKNLKGVFEVFRVENA